MDSLILLNKALMDTHETRAAGRGGTFVTASGHRHVRRHAKRAAVNYGALYHSTAPKAHAGASFFLTAARCIVLNRNQKPKATQKWLQEQVDR